VRWKENKFKQQQRKMEETDNRSKQNCNNSRAELKTIASKKTDRNFSTVFKKGNTSKVERKRNEEGIKRSRETTAVQGERE
jgi:hypothetical protein